jgi:hypothetical protein
MKSVLSSCLPPLTDCQSAPPWGSCIRRCPKDQSTRLLAHGVCCGRLFRAARILLFTIGVAAFVFSAISPDDDDIQQEFLQPGSYYPRIAQIGKPSPTHIRGNRKITSALVLARCVSPHQEWEASFVVDLSGSVPILAPVGGQRSPPLCCSVVSGSSKNS